MAGADERELAVIDQAAKNIGLAFQISRISVGPVKLGMLKPGTYRDLTPDELRALRNAIGKGEADGAKPKPAKSKPRTAGARSKSGNPNKPRNRR